MIDAGSSGCDTFGGFPKHIIPNASTEIICFLHICRTGLATTPDIFSPTSIDLDQTIQVISDNKGIISGVKARMVSPALEIMGMEMPKLAKRAAKEAGVKLMVHIGDTLKRIDGTEVPLRTPWQQKPEDGSHVGNGAHMKAEEPHPAEGKPVDETGSTVQEARATETGRPQADASGNRPNAEVNPSDDAEPAGQAAEPEAEDVGRSEIRGDHANGLPATPSERERGREQQEHRSEPNRAQDAIPLGGASAAFSKPSSMEGEPA